MEYPRHKPFCATSFRRTIRTRWQEKFGQHRQAKLTNNPPATRKASRVASKSLLGRIIHGELRRPCKKHSPV